MVKMNNDSLILNLDKIIDIGNPAQVQLYTDILSEQNSQNKIEKIIKLISMIQSNLIENPNNSTKLTTQNTPTQSEQISRLLGHLQHFVSILQSFSFDSEFLDLFISNKEPSSKLIPSQFFEAESKRLQAFLQTFPDKSLVDTVLSQINPEFLTQKLKELRLIQNKVENSTNVLELRNHFQEICTLFEFSSILNDRLIVKLSNQPKFASCPDSHQQEIEFMSKKLKEKEILNEKYEIELEKLRQLCQNFSNKSDELIVRNQKYKQEKIQLLNQIQEFKQRNGNDETDLRIQNLEKEKQEILDSKNKEIEDLVKKINKISKDFDSLKDQYNNLQHDDSKGDISLMNSDVSEKLKYKHSKLRDKFKKLKQNLKDTKTQLENEKYISNQTQSKNEMLINTMKTEFEQKLSTEIEKCRQFEQENEKLNSQNETLITNLTQFKDKFQLVKSQTTNEIDSLNRKISILQKQKRELVNIVERLNEKAPTDSEINETITALQIEKNELQIQNEQLMGTVNELKARNENLVKVSNDIAETFESRIGTFHRLKKEIKTLTRIKDQIESEIQLKENTFHSSEKGDNSEKEIGSISNINETNQVDSLGIESDRSSILNQNDLDNRKQLNSLDFISHGSPAHQHQKRNDHEMNISKFAMMLANALSEPLELNQIKNEVFRLIDIVRNEHSKFVSSQITSSLLPNHSDQQNSTETIGHISSSVPILIPQFDDLDREIMNLQRSIRFK